MSENEKDIDEATGVDTTGHEWDGIKELNNPLPLWWLWTFYATIVFSIGYMIAYPAIPLLEGATAGVLGTSNRTELKVEMAALGESRRDRLAQLAQKDLETIRNDENLVRFAAAGGASLYKVYCTQCHGSGAAGGPGYPNLNDDDWLWGGDLEAIYTTIKHGVRNDEDDDARLSEMPAFGKDEILERDEINAVTEYVLKLSNQEHDVALATTGQEVYMDNCSSCHGDNGRGGREFGAPNLADSISLYGNTRSTIRAQIVNPQLGVMLPWIERLGDASIKQLAIYVHALGGGEAAPVEE
ncbi:MAG: cytochrome-c oxidase, cbb3-type subunit III [Pseudomonadota bacterium]